jgi:hypothetical protein
VPSESYPTLQSAVDAIPRAGKILLTSGYTTELTTIQNKEIEIVGSNPNAATIIHTVRNLSQVAFTLVGRAKLKLSRVNFIHGLYSIQGFSENGNRPDLELNQVSVNGNVYSSVTGPTKVIVGEFRNLLLQELHQYKGEGSGVDLTQFEKFEIKNSSLKSKPGRGITLSTDQEDVLVNITSVSIHDFENGGIVLNNLYGKINLNSLSLVNIGRAGILSKNSGHVAILNSSIQRGSGTNQFYDGIVSEQSSIFIDNVTIQFPTRYGIYILACGDSQDRRLSDISNTRIQFMQAGHSWASARKTPCLSEDWNWFPGGQHSDQIMSDGFEPDQSGNICVDSMSGPPRSCSPFHALDTFGY